MIALMDGWALPQCHKAHDCDEQRTRKLEMRKVGGMWVLDSEKFFDQYFASTYDRYTPEPVEEALKHVTGFRTMIDGGAHYGTVSRLVRGRFKRVMAFEPNPEVYECLVKNTVSFPNIETFPKALGDTTSQVSVGLAPERYKYLGTDQELGLCNSGCIQVLGPGAIEMIVIDSLEVDDLDFLKLDIEGFEYAALKGALSTIRRTWPVILLEDNGNGHRYGLDGTECRRFLTDLGYSCVYSVPYGDFVYARRKELRN
jgi:FkbM family methyltransferase